MEDPIANLVSVVKAHYENSTKPLYLSALGGMLKDDRKGLIENFGSLGQAVKAAGANQLETINDDVPGAMVVVTPEVKKGVEARLAEDVSGGEASFDMLPTPIKIAFCLKIDAGQVVAVKLTLPMRYQRFDSGTALPSGFIIIDGKHRFPGLDLRTATAKEKERLWREYLSWAAENKIDPDFLRKAPSQSNALERLLAAQSPEILDKIVFPADIVAILIRHS